MSDFGADFVSFLAITGSFFGLFGLTFVDGFKLILNMSSSSFSSNMPLILSGKKILKYFTKFIWL